MPHRCILGCKGTDVLHVFPNPRKFHNLFKTWVEIVGGKPENLSDNEFHYKMRICDIHFSDNHKNRNKRLNALALPCLHLPGMPRVQQPVVASECQPSASKPIHVNLARTSMQLENQRLTDEKVEEIANSAESPKHSMLQEHDYCFSLSQNVVPKKSKKTTKRTSNDTLTLNKKIHQTTLKNLRREVHRLRKENYAFKMRLKIAEELLNKRKMDKEVQTIQTPEYEINSHISTLKKKNCLIMTDEGVVHSLPFYV
ncbi:uncharacterized protein LOC119834006 isoform X1 [Zerene cesonia]|uniref:uncharacterized protein LOC119834006 isoform X1 n=1 Tax=Zerene cesonia TaxID=33412 RepID=UPI0018E59595|nr:uncharacterized protein LOC119834006 isoform X1 [Zerene cesonia]